MKDSQQMSVEISNPNDMAVQALPPVGLKDNNIFPVPVVEDDLLDEDFHLHLSEDENENKNAKISDVISASQESEEDILDKFINSDKDPECNGLSKKAEEMLLDDDSPKLNDDPFKLNCDSQKNDDSLKLNEDSLKLNEDSLKLNEDSLKLNEDSLKLNEDSLKLNEDSLKLNEDSLKLNEDSLKSNEDSFKLNEDSLKSNEDSLKLNEDSVALNDDSVTLHDDCIPSNDDPLKSNEDPHKSNEDPLKLNDDSANVNDGSLKLEDETEKSDEKSNSDNVENEEEKVEQEEEEEKNEKVNAELLEDQIMDTEHLLQIADKQQEDAEDTKDSCSSNSETAEKGEDPEGEKIENGEEEEEDENDKMESKEDESVDIEENTLYKEDIDNNTEIDKEYENIANESEEKADMMDKEVSAREVGEKEIKDSDVDMEVSSCEPEEEVARCASTKRSLSDTESPSDAKKPKLSEETEETPETVPERVPTPPPAPKIQTLNIISEFMQKKKLKKLTREDLEEICLLKMCEAIGHKSEIGELRHQLGVQEQMIDMWRKEAAQLTKQARDLEIVNKRLLHEVRLKNDRDKPLIPVKITRSVGLQVRSDNNVINNVISAQKRRFNRPQPVTTPVATAKTPNRAMPAKPTTPVTAPTNSISNSKAVSNKIVSTPTKTISQQPVPKPKSILPKTPSSLLSKALQNLTQQPASGVAANSSHTPVTNAASTTPTTNTPATGAHKSLPIQSAKSVANASKPAESKIIDLTDEDDKKPIIVTTAGGTLPSTPQGVRIVSAPVKTTTVVSSSTVVNPPRIMYVYNNQLHQGLIAADSSKIGTQKVMLKLNSNVIGQTNGVIVSNGSTLGVTTANIRTNQVQPVRLTAPVTTVRTTTSSKPVILKHPAPLPPPPITQMAIAARKPIPPKPHLSIRRSSGGIVLSWKMPYNLDNYESIASYQLYAYQETTSAPSSDMWRKVGDVKALALPMACTLTQFADGNKYHFAVRAVDVQKRMGPFSDPEQILL